MTLFAAVLGLAAGASAHAAGPTTGYATFKAAGTVKEYKPGAAVWTGGFLGTSVTDARKGALHNSAWECSGETIMQDGTVHRSGGFCLVTDPDGDVINLIWEQTNTPAQAGGEAKTRGTYLSGSGKYSGIKGHYTLACRFAGAMAVCDITGGNYTAP